MKSSSMLSRNFFRRPRVRALLPEQKLLLAVLTISCESHVGVYLPGDLAKDCGLDIEAADGGLADLETKGFVLTDKNSGEIFVCDFFRDNTFKTAPRRGQAAWSWIQIESAHLREKVLVAVANNPSCGLQKSDLLENQTLKNQDKARQDKDKTTTTRPPKAAGDSVVLVRFRDGSDITCRAEWADALTRELAGVPNTKIETTCARYAAGILRKWESQGAPSGDAIVQAERDAETDELSHLLMELARLDRHSFMTPAGVLVGQVESFSQDRVFLRTASGCRPLHSLLEARDFLDAVAQGRLLVSAEAWV